MDNNTAHSAATYIAKILSSSPSSDLMDIFLDEGNFASTFSTAAFQPLSCPPEGHGAAIDGSSYTILDGHTFIVGGQRVGAVIANENGVIKTQASDVTIDIISRHDHQEVFVDRYRKALNAHPPSVPASLEETKNALRALDEHLLARSLINKLTEGDVIMLDGTLVGSHLLEPVIKGNSQRAAEKGIHLVGVCKRSGLYTEQLPVLSWVTREGNAICHQQRWCYPLSEERGIYIARLHPAAQFAFRIDVNPLEPSPTAVLAKLAVFADDVTCVGYPYPLAHAHRTVVIDTEEGLILREHLQEMVLHKGYTFEDWESVFFDYHHYLG